MRLIDVDTLKLKEFMGSQLDELDYAILSHTWGEEEVTFQEMQNFGRALDTKVRFFTAGDGAIRSKKGFQKVFHAAQQAKRHGLSWVWVDTCCIDKTSSAELSEAINSMYMWYQRSKVCYAYLADVPSYPPVEEDDDAFCRSRWFTRGWTLQELVAPRHITFYSMDWTVIGEKIDVSQTRSGWIELNCIWSHKGRLALCKASGIPYGVLFEGEPPDRYSVAQRMSWAARRVCTRIEDTAYCMMGLFEVNMPLLYGEETKAFTRLQEEILKATDDHSIFAWTIPESECSQTNLNWTPRPVLAPSPSYFVDCGDVVANGREDGALSTLTKHGLRIEADLEPDAVLPYAARLLYRGRKCYWMPLNCSIRSGKVLQHLCLPIVEIEGPMQPRAQTHCYRIGTTKHTLTPTISQSGEGEFPDATGPLTVYVRQKLPDYLPSAPRNNLILRFNNVRFRRIPNIRALRSDIVGCPGLTIETADLATEKTWSTTLNCLCMEEATLINAFILGKRFCGNYFVMKAKDEGVFLLLVFFYESALVSDELAAGTFLHVSAIPCNVEPRSGAGWDWYTAEAERLSQDETYLYKQFPAVLPEVRVGDKVLRIRVERAEEKNEALWLERTLFTVSFECEEAAGDPGSAQ